MIVSQGSIHLFSANPSLNAAIMGCMTQTDHYDQFAQFYDNGTSTDNIEKVKLLEGIIQRLNPDAKSILEIACGTGNVLEPLSKHHEVTGLDLSPHGAGRSQS